MPYFGVLDPVFDFTKGIGLSRPPNCGALTPQNLVQRFTAHAQFAGEGRLFFPQQLLAL